VSVLSKFLQGKEGDLVDLLATFYEKYDAGQRLMRWAIQHEVSITDDPEDLFRKGSFATQLMYRYFFSELGKKYLRATVLPLITSIIEADPVSLEYEPNLEMGVTPEQCGKNLDFLFKQTSRFLEQMSNEIVRIPLYIREGFETLKQEVRKKFPQAKSVVPSVLFLRYLGPTIIQPHTYGLIDRPPKPPAFKALLVVSKLLQTIANGIVKNTITTFEPHDIKIKAFVQEKIPFLKQFCRKMIDPKDIQYCQTLIESSVEKAVIPEDVKAAALREVYNYLTEYKMFAHIPKKEKKEYLAVVNPSPADHQAIINRVLQQRNSREWKLISRKQGYDLFRRKMKATVFMFKTNGRLRATVDDFCSVVDNLTEQDWPKIFRSIDAEKCKLIQKKPNSQDWLIYAKFQLPYQDRDYLFTRLKIRPSEKEVMYISFPIERDDMPTMKGVVRGVMESHYFVKVNEDDSEQLDFTFMNYVDPKGVIPTWTKKSRGLSCLEAALTLKSIVEQVHAANVEKQSKQKEHKEHEKEHPKEQQQQSSHSTTPRRKGGQPPSAARAKRALFRANRTFTLKEDYKETLLKLQEKNKTSLSNTNKNNLAESSNNTNTKNQSSTLAESASSTDLANADDHKVLRRIQSQVNSTDGGDINYNFDTERKLLSPRRRDTFSSLPRETKLFPPDDESATTPRTLDDEKVEYYDGTFVILVLIMCVQKLLCTVLFFGVHVMIFEDKMYFLGKSKKYHECKVTSS